MTTGTSRGLAFTLVDAVTSLVFWRLLAAVVSGLLLSASFPPLCWDLLPWIALVPLLFMPQPRGWFQRCLTGYVFGYVHFSTSLLWLNEVGFGAGFLLALYCALYPMAWYCLMCCLLQQMRELKTDELPGASFLYIKSPWKLAVIALSGAGGWTALEWLRSMLFTGFSWNQLGISQYMRTGLIQIAAYTGVYGVSFLLVLVNMILTIEASYIAWMYLAHRRHPAPWHFMTLLVVLIPFGICAHLPHKLPHQGTKTFDALVVQGNLPQQRMWTEEKLIRSMETYRKLTEEAYAAADDKPELVIWPESAVPAPLNYDGYRQPRNEVLAKIPCPFLVGAIHHRFGLDGNPKSESIFNSAFLLDPQAPSDLKVFNPADHIVDYYDKVHCVPFGEYTPFASVFPWLPGIIGMGRDLTPGKSFHCLTLKNGVKVGVNICFEDVFSEPSREFTKAGGQLLMTITNDSWYNQSAGAHQHMSHVVFRAVENRRPFLRCGSNSHTCYITPNGVVSPLLRDEVNDSDFIAGAQIYELPIHEHLEMTYYTRHGDEFAKFMLLLTMGLIAWMLHEGLVRRRQRLAVLTAAIDEAKQRIREEAKAKAKRGVQG